MRKTTVGLLVVTIAGLAAYDVVPGLLDPAQGDTISEVVRDWGSARPWFAFALGAIFGHFFGWHDRLVGFRKRFPWSPAVLASLGAAVVAADYGGLLPDVHPLLSFGVGLPIGALLWAQRPPTSDAE